RKLAQHRQRDHAADEILRVYALETVVRLQREHHAGEHRREKDDRNRIDTDPDHLAEPFVELERRPYTPRHRPPQHAEPEAGLLEEPQEDAADTFEEAIHAKRDRMVSDLPSRYTRGTRALTLERTSWEIVPIFAAISSAVIPSPR